VLWTRAARPGELSITLTANAGGAPRHLTRVATAVDDLVVRATLAGLTPATRYRYTVVQNGERVDGEFGTAPPPGEPARVTFLWSGDLGGRGFCRPARGDYRIFRAMARYPADFFLFVGDTTYADVPCDHAAAPGADFRATTLAQYRARHRHNREDAAFQDFLRRTPVYAIWDDHEVRNDFAGPREPRMPVARQAFLEYWPVVAGADATRLYRSVRWGSLLEVFILDTRQYRSANTLADGPAKTMLGATQRQWLLDAVPASTATWKLVVSSVSLSVPTGSPARRDGWSNANVFGLAPDNGTGFVTERDAILRHFRRGGVRNLVVVTADVHHAELIRHQPDGDWTFHEFIAGPLSAPTGRPRPLDLRLWPHTIFAQGGLHNFGEVTIEPTALVVRLVDEAGTVMFTHRLTPD
jgi:alkaline phosphatase D